MERQYQWVQRWSAFFLKKKKKDNKSNVVATLLLQPNQMFQC